MAVTYGRAVRVEFTGMETLRAMLDPGGNERAIQLGLTNVAIDVAGRAKSQAPVKTARLQRTIHVWGRQSGPRRIIVAGSSQVRYAAAQEAGSGLHGPKHQKYPIRPKNKKYLFFPSQQVTTNRFGGNAKLKFRKSGKLSNKSMRRYGNAAYVLTRLVMHPGVKATHYMRDAIEQSPMAEIIAKSMVHFWRSRGGH